MNQLQQQLKQGYRGHESREEDSEQEKEGVIKERRSDYENEPLSLPKE